MRTLAIIASALLTAGVVVAQEAPSPDDRRAGKKACKADVERLCGDVDGRRGVKRCLKENTDGLSAACRARVEQRMERRKARHEAIKTACGADVEAHCAEAEGRRAVRRCMKENRDQLSEGCQAALKTHRKRGKRRGPPPDADEG